MLNVLHTHPCPSHVFVFSEPDIKMHVRTINDPKTQMRGKIIKSEDIFFVSSSSSSKFEEVRLSKKKLKEAEVSAHGILTYAFLASFLAYHLKMRARICDAIPILKRISLSCVYSIS